MKYTILSILLILSHMAVGQAVGLVKIPGTKCSLIPPKGFLPSSTFSGFQHEEKGASIMVNELPAPFQTLVDGFTADALSVRGMSLIKKEIIDFNGAKAAFIEVAQTANGIKYLKQILIFGASSQTIIVNGIYPESSKDIKVMMKESLLSVVFNASQDDNPLEAVPFRIDTQDTDFKFIKYLSGSLLYSTDGKIPTINPTLIIANSFSKIVTENRRQYAEDRLKKLPQGEQNVIKESNEINIDDLEGIEIIANGKTSDDIPILIYQVMLFNEIGDYYLIIGECRESFEENLLKFKKVAKTFKLN